LKQISEQALSFQQQLDNIMKDTLEKGSVNHHLDEENEKLKQVDERFNGLEVRCCDFDALYDGLSSKVERNIGWMENELLSLRKSIDSQISGLESRHSEYLCDRESRDQSLKEQGEAIDRLLCEIPKIHHSFHDLEMNIKDTHRTMDDRTCCINVTIEEERRRVDDLKRGHDQLVELHNQISLKLEDGLDNICDKVHVLSTNADASIENMSTAFQNLKIQLQACENTNSLHGINTKRIDEQQNLIISQLQEHREGVKHCEDNIRLFESKLHEAVDAQKNLIVRVDAISNTLKEHSVKITQDISDIKGQINELEENEKYSREGFEFVTHKLEQKINNLLSTFREKNIPLMSETNHYDFEMRFSDLHALKRKVEEVLTKVSCIEEGRQTDKIDQKKYVDNVQSNILTWLGELNIKVDEIVQQSERSFKDLKSGLHDTEHQYLTFCNTIEDLRKEHDIRASKLEQTMRVTLKESKDLSELQKAFKERYNSEKSEIDEELQFLRSEVCDVLGPKMASLINQFCALESKQYEKFSELNDIVENSFQVLQKKAVLSQEHVTGKMSLIEEKLHCAIETSQVDKQKFEDDTKIMYEQIEALSLKLDGHYKELQEGISDTSNMLKNELASQGNLTRSILEQIRGHKKQTLSDFSCLRQKITTDCEYLSRSLAKSKEQIISKISSLEQHVQNSIILLQNERSQLENRISDTNQKIITVESNVNEQNRIIQTNTLNANTDIKHDLEKLSSSFFNQINQTKLEVIVETSHTMDERIEAVSTSTLKAVDDLTNRISAFDSEIHNFNVKLSAHMIQREEINRSNEAKMVNIEEKIDLQCYQIHDLLSKQSLQLDDIGNRVTTHDLQIQDLHHKLSEDHKEQDKLHQNIKAMIVKLETNFEHQFSQIQKSHSETMAQISDIGDVLSRFESQIQDIPLTMSENVKVQEEINRAFEKKLTSTEVKSDRHCHELQDNLSKANTRIAEDYTALDNRCRTLMKRIQDNQKENNSAWSRKFEDCSAQLSILSKTLASYENNVRTLDSHLNEVKLDVSTVKHSKSNDFVKMCDDLNSLRKEMQNNDIFVNELCINLKRYDELLSKVKSSAINDSVNQKEQISKLNGKIKMAGEKIELLSEAVQKINSPENSFVNRLEEILDFTAQQARLNNNNMLEELKELAQELHRVEHKQVSLGSLVSKLDATLSGKVEALSSCMQRVANIESLTTKLLTKVEFTQFITTLIQQSELSEVLTLFVTKKEMEILLKQKTSQDEKGLVELQQCVLQNHKKIESLNDQISTQFKKFLAQLVSKPDKEDVAQCLVDIQEVIFEINRAMKNDLHQQNNHQAEQFEVLKIYVESLVNQSVGP
jgi:chromosome segregation ATPase